LFTNQYLSTHLSESSSIEVEAAIHCEINMNYAENISLIGNYRNRPADAEAIRPIFGTDNENRVFYEGYTDSDVVIDGGYDVSENLPAAFSSIDVKKKLLFSLEDCIQRFRPRSGINKAVSYGNFPGHFSHNTSTAMMKRPRYYIADKDDKFKYWTSFRTEQSGTTATTVERGISNKAATLNSRVQYYIDDVAPFVVYKNKIPVNRIILKMQTHVGTATIGNVYNGSSSNTDPLYDAENEIINRTVPINWKIQYLDPDTNNWVDAKTFNNTDNSDAPLIPRDGYLELHYANSEWSVGSQTLSTSTPFFTDFNNQNSTQFKYIKGVRIVVDTMSKKDVPFELIEISPRLAIDMTDIIEDYKISKVASDLGVSGLPVGQLLASTGSITIADFDQVLNLNNPSSVIAPYVKRNMQVKFYEIVKNVPSPTTLTSYYVPIKTMYAESFPEINNESRTATIKLRDLYFYFESLTAPQALFADVSFSYAIAMLLDSIGYSNYIYLKSNKDKDLIIPYFYVGPNTTVAQVLQRLAISTQTAMFFDEYNNLVLMSKSYMLASAGDRNLENPSSEISLQLAGSKDSTRSGRAKNATEAGANLANIIEVSSKNNDVFNDGKIIYTSRYIQKTYKEIRQANLVDEDKVWVYKPALLWEVAPSENTKSINEEKASQAAYTLSAIPLNSNLTKDLPTVNSSRQIVNNVIDMGEAIFWMPRYNGYFYSNGEIIKFDAVEYSVSQPSVTPEFTVNLANTTTNIVAVTSGSIANLKVGDKIIRTGGAGDGRFGSNTTVTAVNTTASTFTVTSNHTVSGTTNVAAKLASANYWITNVEDYQEYFSKVPFNGKIYPTGKVRIFTEPNYEKFNPATGLIDNNAALNTATRLKQGAVAKHGRGQFNTEVKDHTVGLPSWVNNNIAGCAINSTFTFTNPYKERFAVTTVAGTTGKKIYLAESFRKYVRVGQKVSGTGIANGSRVKSKTAYGIKLDKDITTAIGAGATITLSGVKIYDYELVEVAESESGMVVGDKSSQALAAQGTRTSLIRNFMSSSYTSENQTTSINSTQTGKVQSSALVMSGPTFPTDYNAKDFLSYSYKTLDGKYSHFGTRMRVIGTLENNQNVYQSPAGSMPYYSLSSKDSTVPTIINGGGGGIGIFVNPTKNTGYFFELSALTVKSFDKYEEGDDISNLHFYKVAAEISGDRKIKSVPKTLWRGKSSIIVDDGRFTGQYRDIAEQNPSVYDLAIECEEVKDQNTNSIKFYLYVNGKLVGSVTDEVPIKDRTQNVALFIRGTSKCMFENIYALKTNEASNYSNVSNAPFKESFSMNREYEADEAFSKYSLPAAIQESYLSGISPISTRSLDVFYEEFGTIMREAAYFNVKYDKAYPALIAKIAPTFNKLKGYAISGFVANAYGAEFLVFNTTDKILNLDNTSGNYLRIMGVTFTQEAKHDFTVDEYFQQKSDFSNPEIFKNAVVNDPLNNKKNYQAIKNSRITYGTKEFSIDSEYIQTQDAAESLMSWLTNKVVTPRLSLGISMFANPTLQLGDIVTIDYKSSDSNIDQIIDENTRFVVYNIEYSRNVNGPEMAVYVSEIPAVKEITE
jgi:hypothetical protein